MEAMDMAGEKLKEIVMKHGKAALVESVEVVMPLALEALKKAIPGPVDDAIIDGAKPIAEAALKDLIAKIGA